MQHLQAINSTLSTAFTAAVKTLDNAELKKNREPITTVSLLSLETGLCQLSTPTTPRAGWRLISKEDLAQLHDDNVLLRIGATMATCPALVTCSKPIQEDLARLAEAYWKTGICSQPLREVAVLDVFSSQTHPELYEEPAVTFVFGTCSPQNKKLASARIQEFIDDVYSVAECMLARELLEALPLAELHQLSDKQFVQKLYWFNFGADFRVKTHDLTGQVMVKDVRKARAVEGVATMLLQEHRSGIMSRSNNPQFLEVAKKYLSILPHGDLILAMIADIAAEQECIKKLIISAIK